MSCRSWILYCVFRAFYIWTRGKEAWKYLRKGYYHRIKCSAANFLAALMWKRPLNSATLATSTHRRPEGMSDGTNTQVVAWMINKCTVKIIKTELYNVKDLPWRRDRKFWKRKHYSSLNHICNYFQSIYTRTYLLKLCRGPI